MPPASISVHRGGGFRCTELGIWCCVWDEGETSHGFYTHERTHCARMSTDQATPPVARWKETLTMVSGLPTLSPLIE